MDCSNVSEYPMGASMPRTGESGSIAYLSDNSRGNKKQNSQSWYARMSEEKKAQYIQKQRVARQQKRSCANPVNVSQRQCTPMSNITKPYSIGTYTCFEYNFQ
jgi:hypothetical protein